MKIIYTNNEGGVSVIHPTGELSIEEVIKKDVPRGASYHVVEDADIPSDRTFRSAWRINKKRLDVDLRKAKEVAHDMRRAKRAQEFAPLDEVIMKQIPGTNVWDVEAKRQKIRDKHATLQDLIDKADSVDKLLANLLDFEVTS